MSTIEDLDFTSIVYESTDEALERIRQISLSRRTPVSKPKTTKKSTATSARKQASKAITPELAKELLKMIGD